MISLSNDDNIEEQFTGLMPTSIVPVIRHGLLLLILAAAIGSLTLLPLPGDLFVLARAVQLLLFLVLGWIQVRTAQVRIRPGERNGPDRNPGFITAIAVAILVELLLLYFFMQRAHLFMAFTSTGLFILPLMISEQWKIIDRVPEVRYAPWVLPVGSGGKKASIALNSIQVRIRVSASYFDPEFLLLDIVQPGRDKLGRVLESAIQIQQAFTGALLIELKDDTGKPFAWEFIQEDNPFIGRRYLNPDATLLENSIRDHSTITVKRIKQTLLQASYATDRQ